MLQSVLLSSVRLFAAFSFLPFLNDKFILSRTSRGIVICILALCLGGNNSHSGGDISLLSVLSEIIAGTVTGLIYSTPFFIFAAFGEYIDNQRGANISDTADPTTGTDASPFSTFMNLFSISFFLLNDGLVLLMTSLRDSFRLLPPGTLLTEIRYAAVFDWLTNSLSLSLLFCMPVLIILFISEVSLGILALYNSQLNPFSLSLSIKSIIAFLLALILFRSTTVTDVTVLFDTSPVTHFLRGRDG
ncbi:type III secretion system export apparatus subunit SctT [Morganella morganii]|nr:type III secretion system export apparatus subunit SctT [Morganella morganii]HAE78539.1 EscT/YscT/HrcT family type III secretion system export apparatus protein [Morganella sp. (in: enterobacteria)]QXO48200.1 type III secretion system export apparatus subunit SctT [Morganella morganii]QXO52061.1 type III secretion system export apparatus subunit SctT [Morganella morganii]QXO55923.1 type III secretion system export apparatus subunit SctT [Morganella morganii]